MSSSRLRKRIARALMVSWREQPTRYDIEALEANIRRVGLVIRLRWALLIVLVIYSALAGSPTRRACRRASLVAHAGSRRSRCSSSCCTTPSTVHVQAAGQRRALKHLQLALDAIVVTVLVYYSGGMHSWFWSMYSLFILEAAFILPRRRDAWSGGLCALLLGSFELLEFWGWSRTSACRSRPSDLQRPSSSSPSATLAGRRSRGTAAVATQLVGAQRAESAARQQFMVLDEATGLYSRSYFMRALSSRSPVRSATTARSTCC